MRVAIVGSGIAGLTAAWLMHRSGQKVTLFEEHDRLGLDFHSINIKRRELDIHADIPLRMFSLQLWPNLLRLYDAIGVAYEPVDTSQSFGRQGKASFLRLDKANKPSLSTALRMSPQVRQIKADITRLKDQGSGDLENGLSVTVGLRDYLESAGYSRAFVFGFLYPTLSSTVCTCSYRSLDEYPARIILETLRDLNESPALMRTTYGTGDVANRLTVGIDDIRCNTPVVAAETLENGVQIKTAEHVATFDHLIVATQSNGAMSILPRLSNQEREMLTCFTYENINVVVHSDGSLMPIKRKDWATFNMISSSVNHRDKSTNLSAGPDQLDVNRDASMCTIWMNRFNKESAFDTPLFQTINPLFETGPGLTVCHRRMQRPVINQRSLKGLELLTALHEEPNRRVWFCGSYASDGVSLLESGVVSSLRVAKAMGVNIPWTLQSKSHINSPLFQRGARGVR